MKFLNSLIARIWGPFMLMAVLLTAMVGLYIPIQQAKTLREFQMSELEEVVKVMSNNISIAGQYDDWSNLNEVFNSASSRPSLEFSALILESNGISALVASNPPNINQQAIDEAAESPLLVRAPFRGGPFKGTVVILGSEAFIQAELTRLNTPLQFAMALILIAVIILYFFLRQKVSKPLRQVRAAAQQIGQGNLQGSKAYDAKIWELKSLNDALDMMRTGLLKERETNQALTKGMENEIKRQTKDLRKTLDELQDSRNLFGNVIARRN
jgi:methyl-accepting chemotaxis protein